MKVLVTGGAGYVGTTLLPLLLDRGYEVTVFDNLMYGGAALVPFFRRPNFQFVTGDVRDSDALASAVRGKDVIVHLAAIVGYPACLKEPRLATEVNLEAAQSLADIVEDDQLVLFASTGSNYGALGDEICTEESPLNPLSHYGVTKTQAEQALRDNVPTIAFRFATAFGLSPRLRLDLLVNDFVHKAVVSKSLIVYEHHFMRTFIHVHDMGRAFCFALDNRAEMLGEVYNVGSDSMNHSKQEVCELIRDRVPDFYLHYAEIGQDADKRNYIVAYDKIVRLGYDTSITLAEGVDELVRGLEAVPFREEYRNT